MPGYRRAYRTARKLYPLMLAAYHRWDSLSEEEKERYRQRAKKYADRAGALARDAAARAPRRRRRR